MSCDCSFTTTAWRPGDSTNIMLAKLLQLFGGSSSPGSGTSVLLQKILAAANQTYAGVTDLNFQDSPGGADAVVFNFSGTTEVARFAGGSLTLSGGQSFNLSGGSINVTSGDVLLTGGRFQSTLLGLTGSNPGLTLNQTWNNIAGAFTALDVQITDTASPSDNTTLLYHGAVNGTTVFRVRKDGTVFGTRFTGLSAVSGSSQEISDAATNTTPNLLTLTHNSSAAALAGFGGTLQFSGKSATVASRAMARVQAIWQNPVEANLTSQLDFYTFSLNAPIRGFSVLGNQALHADGQVGAPSVSFINENTTGFYRSAVGQINFTVGGTARYAVNATATTLEASNELSWGSVGVTLPDTKLFRDAANTLAQRNGVNAQTFRVYRTYTGAGDYERLAMQFASTVGVSGQLAVSTAGTGTDDINLVLTPAGLGALIAGTPADNLVPGGNARGQCSVDLQMTRSANTQVASGNYSFLGGGSANTANTAYASTVGGAGNFATGTYSFVGGGTASVASGQASVASGIYANATKQGQRSHANGRFSTQGDAQISWLVARRQTTDATPLALTLDGGAPGAGNRIPIASDTSWAYKVTVVGRNTAAAGDDAAYEFTGVIRNNAGTTSLNQFAKNAWHESIAGWDCDVTADDANDALLITVTGTALTVNWVARIELVEVTG